MVIKAAGRKGVTSLW